MSDIRLRECPFCGGDAFLNKEKVATVNEASVIQCRSCGAKGAKFVISSNYSCDEKAVEAWNNRV